METTSVWSQLALGWMLWSDFPILQPKCKDTPYTRPKKKLPWGKQRFKTILQRGSPQQPVLVCIWHWQWSNCMTSNQALIDCAMEARWSQAFRYHVSPCHPLAQEVEAFKCSKLLKARINSKATITRSPVRPGSVFTLKAEQRNHIARGQSLQ